MPSRMKQKRRGRQHRASTFESLPLDDFFAKYYPEFQYNSTKSASHEFYRLCKRFGWDREAPERAEAHRNFKDALVRQFNEVYGTNEDNLANWQNLCHTVRIEPVPDDLHACREAIHSTFVNLVDLVDTDTTGEDVEVFESERKLSGLLRYLLRHILHPATEGPSRRRNKKHR